MKQCKNTWAIFSFFSFNSGKLKTVWICQCYWFYTLKKCYTRFLYMWKHGFKKRNKLPVSCTRIGGYDDNIVKPCDSNFLNYCCKSLNIFQELIKNFPLARSLRRQSYFLSKQNWDLFCFAPPPSSVSELIFFCAPQAHVIFFHSNVLYNKIWFVTGGVKNTGGKIE